MSKDDRYLWEVVVVERDCEIGKEGERGVVISLDDRYMTVLFPDREFISRKVHTGRDYLYLKTTITARGGATGGRLAK